MESADFLYNGTKLCSAGVLLMRGTNPPASPWNKAPRYAADGCKHFVHSRYFNANRNCVHNSWQPNLPYAVILHRRSGMGDAVVGPLQARCRVVDRVPRPAVRMFTSLFNARAIRMPGAEKSAFRGQWAWYSALVLTHRFALFPL